MTIRAGRLAAPLLAALLAMGCGGDGSPVAALWQAAGAGAREDADTSSPPPAARDGRVGVAALSQPLGVDGEDASEPGPGYWRYTEANGSLRFVQSLAEVPASARATAQHIATAVPREGGSRAAPPPAPARARRSQPVPDPPARRASPTVIVYTTSWCPWCRKTLAWLDERGIDYENRDIERNDEWAAELRRKTGRTSIPVVDVDGQLVRGFDRSALERLL